MAQVIELDTDSCRWTRNTQPQAAAVDDDIWPEVSTRHSLETPAPANPQNTQARVLFEVLLILAIAGIGAMFVTLLGPLLSQ